MRVISPLLKHVIYPGLAQSGYFQREADQEPVVITYHGVLPPDYSSLDRELDGSLVSIEALRSQLALLHRQYRIISPQQYLDWRLRRGELPPKSVLITCDDGLRNLKYMLPVLSEANVKCLFFATGLSAQDHAAMLWHEELRLILLLALSDFSAALPRGNRSQVMASKRKPGWWELVEDLSAFDAGARQTFIENIREHAGIERSMWRDLFDRPGMEDRFLVVGKNELGSLIKFGHTVGAHSLSHPLLSRSSDDAAWLEIAKSCAALEVATKQRIWAFAYPFGTADSISARDIGLVKGAGLECAFLNEQDEHSGDNYAIPRVHITRKMTLAEFQAHVSGFHHRLRRRFRQQVGA